MKYLEKFPSIFGGQLIHVNDVSYKISDTLHLQVALSYDLLSPYV